MAIRLVFQLPVALRKESVDRNSKTTIFALFVEVALRKESVDRNPSALIDTTCNNMSLSARRAWIEIGRGKILLK